MLKTLRAACAALLFAISCSVFATDPVNLNTANVEVLAKLKGIGPNKAAAIVHYREANGPFSSVDQLIKVKGIGQRTLDDNRDVLVIE